MKIEACPLPIPQFEIRGLKVTKVLKGWLFSSKESASESKKLYMRILKHIHKTKDNILWGYLEKEGFLEAYPSYETKQKKIQKMFVQHVSIYNENFSRRKNT
jgi:hypothetical protein